MQESSAQTFGVYKVLLLSSSLRVSVSSSFIYVCLPLQKKKKGLFIPHLWNKDIVFLCSQDASHKILETIKSIKK